MGSGVGRILSGAKFGDGGSVRSGFGEGILILGGCWAGVGARHSDLLVSAWSLRWKRLHIWISSYRKGRDVFQRFVVRRGGIEDEK